MLDFEVKKPKQITFEGIDGSGKGTQSQLVVKALEEQGFKVLVMDFPQYSDFFGKEIGILLSGDDVVNANTLRPKDVSIWYALDRYKRYKEVNLSDYDYVILNRSTFSNMGYQTTRIPKEEKEQFLHWLHELEFNILNIPQPDLVLVFKITVEQSNTNVKDKEARDYLNGKESDVYESNENMLSNAQQTYIDLKEKYDYIEIIECMEEGKMKPLQDISNIVLDKIKSL